MTPTYPAAYTHREASRGDEAQLLVAWLLSASGNVVLAAPARSNYVSAEFLGTLGLARRPQLIDRNIGDLSQHKPAKVLALWPTSQLLGKIDERRDAVTAVAVLPWGLDEIAPWCVARGAVDLLGLAPTPPARSIANPVVLGAMREITMGVNMSAPLSHPSDHDRIVSAFRLLLRSGHGFDVSEIRAWALANGWAGRDVDELVDKVQRIAQGRVVKLKTRGPSVWRFDQATLHRWAARGTEVGP